MIPIVNDTYKYIIYYAPKSACSFIRKLFYDLHRTEKKVPIKSEFHNIVGYFPYLKKHEHKYKNYIRVMVARNPYERALSMYYCLVFANAPKTQQILDFIKNCESFTKFLTKIQNFRDADLNMHFRNQMYNPHNYLLPNHIVFTDDLKPLVRIFKTIFAKDEAKYNYVVSYIEKDVRLNKQTYLDYGKDMSTVNLYELPTLIYPSFNNMLNKTTEQLIYNKYKLDFDALKIKRYIL
jgi:hypothetical protein